MLPDAIHTRLDSLSRSERKVADVVLKNPQLAVSGNITALAKAAQVSEPTVVRFCRALGYDGWHEFKLKLAQSLALALPQTDLAPVQNDVASDLVNKICNRSLNTLLDLRNNLQASAIERAIGLLSRASRIEIWGQGTSGIIATDAQHKFFRSGVPTIAYADPHIHAVSAAMMKKGDVALAISQHGSDASLLHSVQLARKAGADVIALTPSGTPLAAAASVPVPIDVSVDNDPYTPISARLAHLVVIDILTVGLALKGGPAFRKKMQNAHKAMQKHDMQSDVFLRQAARPQD